MRVMKKRMAKKVIEANSCVNAIRQPFDSLKEDHAIYPLQLQLRFYREGILATYCIRRSLSPTVSAFAPMIPRTSCSSDK